MKSLKWFAIKCVACIMAALFLVSCGGDESIDFDTDVSQRARSISNRQVQQLRSAMEVPGASQKYRSSMQGKASESLDDLRRRKREIEQKIANIVQANNTGICSICRKKYNLQASKKNPSAKKSTITTTGLPVNRKQRAKKQMQQNAQTKAETAGAGGGQKQSLLAQQAQPGAAGGPGADQQVYPAASQGLIVGGAPWNGEQSFVPGQMMPPQQQFLPEQQPQQVLQPQPQMLPMQPQMLPMQPQPQMLPMQPQPQYQPQVPVPMMPPYPQM